MPLIGQQVHLVGAYRDLLMGDSTRFDLQDTFNPFATQVRADNGGDRPYAHGAWVGAEWQAERVVPIRVIANGANGDVPTTRQAVHDMAAAFSAVGATGEIAELRFRLAGDSDEFVLFGRPRGIDPDLSTFALGYAYVSTAFVASDPRIYSGALTTVSTALPAQQGGLTLPFTMPFTIDGTLISGRLDLTNTGTAAAGLQMRIDGPVVDPLILLRRPDGLVQSIEFTLTLAADQWLQIDTTSTLALLNGLPQSNQRGSAAWDMDPFPLLPGVSELRFTSPVYNDTARITVEHRSAWW